MAYISFQPTDFVNPVLYTGTEAELAITGVGFQPGVVWIKNRASTEGQDWFDAVRGATKFWASNNTDNEATNAQTLKSFDSDGFTLGTSDATNKSGEASVAWNWKLGTTTGIAGSPSITPTAYSFNATAGHSVITYTGNGVAGATLPHGLGVAPEFMFTQNLDMGGRDNHVYHVALGPTKRMYLNQTSAYLTNSTSWNDTAPTSTLFSVGTNEGVNENTKRMVAYCFASTKGYSKMGVYYGNGNANGTFVYTGFRPAVVLIKNADAVQSWNIFDNKRSTSGTNVTNLILRPNTNAAESTSSSNVQEVDLLSNGFKCRATNDEVNSGSQTMVYAAFAEFPLVSSNDIPGVAR